MHAGNGALMAEYARDAPPLPADPGRPDRVKAAFLSAEDKNFYQHPGIDVTGLFRAIVVNVQNMGSGRRPVGASTITQQVAKNFLLSSTRPIDRKVKEAILSFRIEQAYSKDRILELYLNEIFFGLAPTASPAPRSPISTSPSRAHRRRTAYLAALPKGPSNYHPFRHTEAAIERRNWVIDRMVENGYVTQSEARDAEGPAARRHAAARFLSLRLRILLREVRRADHRALRRQRALRRRPVGPHHARSAHPGRGPQGAAAWPA
jgi:penicillin-binding protein 1A